MKTCILQISYLPNYSFFHLMKQCHLTILLDDIKLPKTNVAHLDGKDLEIPVQSWDYFNKVKIVKGSSWEEDHLKALRMKYGKEPHFDEIYPIIEKRLNQKPENVYELQAPDLLIYPCLDFIIWIKTYLGLQCDVVTSSEYGFAGYNYEERCALMCQSTGTTQYVGYDEVNKLLFPHIAVTKLPEPEGVSIIDAMFKKGKECLK